MPSFLLIKLLERVNYMILDFFIDKLSQENYPIIIEDKCLQKIEGSSKCSLCIDACPKSAIDFKANKFEIDKNLCIQCGICKGICPSRAINLKGIGEENILRTISEKKSLVFSCSLFNSTGNMKLSCLNAFDPELLASLFIITRGKDLNFNLSKCESCKLNTNQYFLDNLERAVDFVKLLGINPKYKLYYDNDNIEKLSEEAISRRDLFMLLRKETTSIATEVLGTVVSEGEFLSLRKVLLNAMKNIDFRKVELNPLLTSWEVENSCDGCGECVDKCPSKALNLEKDQSIKLFHKVGCCHKCNLCQKICPKNALKASPFNKADLYNYKMIKEIELSVCNECEVKFIPDETHKEICPICEKKKILRRKLATY